MKTSWALYRYIVIAIILAGITSIFVSQFAIATVGTDSQFSTGNMFTPVSTVIRDIEKQPDGKIIIAGNFTSYRGQSTQFLTRLHVDGTLDNSFVSDVSGIVHDVYLLDDGDMYVAGDFCCEGTDVVGGIVRLNSDGSRDNSFSPTVGASRGGVNPATIYTIGVQSDGKVIIGGIFNSYDAQPVNYLARLNSDGSFDPSFTDATRGLNAPASLGSLGANSVRSIAVQEDDKVVVAGAFDSRSYIDTKSSYTLKSLFRLNSDGSFDSTFHTNTGGASMFSGGSTGAALYDVALQDDGKIIIAGSFSAYQGDTTIRHITRLNQSGTRDSRFAASCSTDFDVIFDVDITSTGKIYAGGTLHDCNGESTSNIFRFDTDGSVDTSFSILPETFDGGFYSIAAVKAENDIGTVLVGGAFSNYGTTPLDKIARLGVGEDSTPPSITFTTPETIDDGALVVSFTVSDNYLGLGIGSIQSITLTDSLGELLVPVCSGLPSVGSQVVNCTVTLNTQGVHTIAATVSDQQNNISQEVISPLYTIDSGNPQIVISAPTKISASPITDTVVTINDVSGLTSVSITGGNFTCSEVLPTTQTSISCSGVVTTSGGLYVTATDSATNTSSISELGYIIDTTPPNFQLVSGGPGSYASTQTLIFSVSDTQGIPVSSITITGVNPYTVSCVDSSPTPSGGGIAPAYQCSLDISSSDSLAINVSDVLGNSTSVSYEYVILPGAPQLLSVSSLESSGTYILGDQIHIQAVFDQAVSEGGYVTILLNNGVELRLDQISDKGYVLGAVYSIEAGDDIPLLAATSVVDFDIQNQFNEESLQLTIPLGGNISDSRSIAIDTIPPAVVTNTVMNGSWSITLSEQVARATGLESSLILSVDGVVAPISSLSTVNDTLTILSSYIDLTSTVSLEYIPGLSPLEDLAGNDTSAFTLTRAGTPPVDPVDPTPVGGGSNSGGGSSTGTFIALTCPDPTAINYQSGVRADVDVCIYSIPGCMNIGAENYNPLATVNNGSCSFVTAPLPVEFLIASDISNNQIVTSIAQDVTIIELKPESYIANAVQTTVDAFVDLVTVIDNPLIPNIIIPFFPDVQFPVGSAFDLKEITVLSSFLATLFLFVHYLTIPTARIVTAFIAPWRKIIAPKKAPWGVVFDTATKTPLADVRISLLNSSGALIASFLTKKDGEFNFIVPDGVYTIDVRKPLYIFPATKQSTFSDYTNLYFGGNITIKKETPTQLNIPIDPQIPMWNQNAEPVRHKDHKEINSFFVHMLNVLYWGGFLFSIFSLIVYPSSYNVIIMVMYLMTLYIRIMGKQSEVKNHKTM